MCLPMSLPMLAQFFASTAWKYFRVDLHGSWLIERCINSYSIYRDLATSFVLLPAAIESLSLKAIAMFDKLSFEASIQVLQYGYFTIMVFLAIMTYGKQHKNGIIMR